MSITKRCFDLAVVIPAIVLTSPLIVVCAIAIRLDSRGPVLFRQRRVGRAFEIFQIIKFRTMDAAAPDDASLGVKNQCRVTRVGRFLQQSKLNELPQLWNVLRGDMSLVGPRPEVVTYVTMFRSDYEEILQVRPGITDAASIRFRNEGELLRDADDPHREYVTRVLPEKIAMAKDYVRTWSLWLDVALIAKTIWVIGLRR